MMLTEGRDLNVTTIDLMGPLLARLSELLASQPLAEPGPIRLFDSGYMERINTIDFTVRDDDGRNLDDINQAQREVAYSYEVFDKRHDWPLVDVITKPIEETAAKVVAIIGWFNEAHIYDIDTYT